MLKADGHDYAALADAFEQAASLKGAPTVILAKTVKGKGVSFMENNAAWHGKAPGRRAVRDCKKRTGSRNKKMGGKIRWAK